MTLARRTRMLRAALALLVVAAVAWAGAMALGSAGTDAAAPDATAPAESDLAYLWVRVTARDEEAQALEVEVVNGELGGHRRGQIPAGSTGTLDCSELLTGVSGIKVGATWVVSYVDEGQVALPVTLYGIESPEHFGGA